MIFSRFSEGLTGLEAGMVSLWRGPWLLKRDHTGAAGPCRSSSLPAHPPTHPLLDADRCPSQPGQEQSAVSFPFRSQVSRCNILKSMLEPQPGAQRYQRRRENRLSVDPVALKGRGFNVLVCREASWTSVSRQYPV